jgi:hypothetical protein
MKITVFAFSPFAVAASGCSGISNETRHAGNTGFDLRGTAPVHAHRARALVSGPAVVKHLEPTGEGASRST